jgi:hypothetical protein
MPKSARWVPAGPALLTLFLTAGPASWAAAGAADHLLPLLEQDDYASERDLIAQQVRGLPGAPCPFQVTAYAGHHATGVREHAIRALADAGCSTFDAYRPFSPDPDPWVAEALIETVERLRIVAAVPFLLERLPDPRTIVSPEGTWTLGQRSHRALRVVTCHSFHYDAAGTPQARADAIAQWRAWYESHRRETRRAWIDSGLQQALDYLQRDYEPHRREGFELLGLIGEPAAPTLRAALRRGPGEIRAALSCQSDRSPRVGDAVPCLLRLENVSGRRIALALGEPVLHLERRAPDAATAPRGRRAPAAAQRSGGIASPASDAALLAEAANLVDLAPGEMLQKELVAGPVETAGEYLFSVHLPDRAGPDPPGAQTLLHFRR